MHAFENENVCVYMRVYNCKHFFVNFRGMGGEFRAWYAQISQLRSMLPSKTPVVALTATATHYVKDCIVHALQMAPLKSITRSVNRPNNCYSVERE